MAVIPYAIGTIALHYTPNSGQLSAFDGHGLCLQVHSPIDRSWRLRYERNRRGERWMGLGPLHAIDPKTKRQPAAAAVDVRNNARQKNKISFPLRSEWRVLMDDVHPKETGELC
jgi:hypothetical protein